MRATDHSARGVAGVARQQHYAVLGQFGLAAGDEVVSHSTALLQEDMSVRVRKP